MWDQVIPGRAHKDEPAIIVLRDPTRFPNWKQYLLKKGGTTATAAAKSLQSCLTLCDPIDGSPPGSAAPGIFQARVLEWGATAFSMFLD